MATVATQPIGIDEIVDIRKYSSLSKVLRITALVLRFIHNLRVKKNSGQIKIGSIGAQEINEAEKVWIKGAQNMLLGDSKFEKVKRQLGVIEENGVLKCTGRLENSDLNVEAEYPVILSKDHKFTELIVLECHNRVHHDGLRSTLGEVRSRFWITQGRQFVKKNHKKVCHM